MRYFTDLEILTINKFILASKPRYSRVNYIQHNDRLQFLIEYANKKGSYFGLQRLSTIYHVAAAYLYFIIKDHIFYDACKRTAVTVMTTFLTNNQYKVKKKLSRIKLTELALKVEKNVYTLDQLARFLQEHAYKG